MSTGDSKSGVETNANAPVTPSREKSAWSEPPVTVYPIDWAGRSASVDVTVIMNVWFSATETVPGDVKTGASLASVTEMTTDPVTGVVPSVAWIVSV